MTMRKTVLHAIIAALLAVAGFASAATVTNTFSFSADYLHQSVLGDNTFTFTPPAGYGTLVSLDVTNTTSVVHNDAGIGNNLDVAVAARITHNTTFGLSVSGATTFATLIQSTGNFVTVAPKSVTPITFAGWPYPPLPALILSVPASQLPAVGNGAFTVKFGANAEPFTATDPGNPAIDLIGGGVLYRWDQHNAEIAHLSGRAVYVKTSGRDRDDCDDDHRGHR